MPTVSAIGTNFNLPQYHGKLHLITPDDAVTHSIIGGVSEGGGQVQIGEHRTFEWQTVDLRARDQRTVVDAREAKDAENRSHNNVFNVIQTHLETIGVGYEKQAQTQQFDGQNIGQDRNPVSDPLRHQINLMLKQIKTDQNWSLVNGEYVLPANNNTAAQTRGLRAAITTNVVNGSEAEQDTTAVNASNKFQTTAHGYADGDTVYLGGDTAPTGLDLDTGYFVIKLDANEFQVAATPGGAALAFTTDGSDVTVRRGRSLDDYLVEDAMQLAWDNGGLRESETRVLLVPSVSKRQITNAYRVQGLQVRSNNIFGVNVLTVENSFGQTHVVMERDLTGTGEVIALSAEQCQLWHRLVPGRGITFAEPLAKDGARDKVQLYSSLGLEYGNEEAHAKIEGLSQSNPVPASD